MRAAALEREAAVAAALSEIVAEQWRMSSEILIGDLERLPERVDVDRRQEGAQDVPPAEALDPTGAGDVFLAGLVLGTLRGWPLQQRLRFANLVAALSVRDFGGALAAPRRVRVGLQLPWLR